MNRAATLGGRARGCLAVALSLRNILLQCTHCAGAANQRKTRKLTGNTGTCTRCHTFRRVPAPIEPVDAATGVPTGREAQVLPSRRQEVQSMRGERPRTARGLRESLSLAAAPALAFRKGHRHPGYSSAPLPGNHSGWLCACNARARAEFLPGFKQSGAECRKYSRGS